MRPYFGLRATFAAPVARPIDDAGGATIGCIPAVGVRIRGDSPISFFLEAGALLLQSFGRAEDNGRNLHGGGYGALGFAVELPTR